MYVDPPNYTDQIRLSILIPTIPKRNAMFQTLLGQLKEQASYCKKIHPTLGLAELVWEDSKSVLDGGISIGEKRQALLERSKGVYICYLDDDEHISPDYVETLLRLCYLNKDVGTFRSIAMLSNNWALIDMSIHNKTNEQIHPEGITLRKPWHVCPVKREIGIKYKFTDSNYGEDWDWFGQVLKDCSNEAHTKKVIHNYNHGAHSEADKIK